MLRFYNGPIIRTELNDPPRGSNSYLLPAVVRFCLLHLHRTMVSGWLQPVEVGKCMHIPAYTTGSVLKMCHNLGCVERGVTEADTSVYRLSELGVEWLRKMSRDAKSTTDSLVRRVHHSFMGIDKDNGRYTASGHRMVSRTSTAALLCSSISLSHMISSQTYSISNLLLSSSLDLCRPDQDILLTMQQSVDSEMLFGAVSRPDIIRMCNDPSLAVDDADYPQYLVKWMSSAYLWLIAHVYNPDNPTPITVCDAPTRKEKCLWPVWNRQVTERILRLPN